MQPQRSHPPLIVRLVAYLAVQGGVLAIYAWAVQRAGTHRLGALDLDSLLRENQVIEWVQITLLFVIGALCMGSFRAGRPALHRLLALGALFAAFRELDSFLEGLLFENAHTLLMTIVAGTGVYYIWRGRKELADQLPVFFRRPGFFLMLFGVSLIVIYAQILGQREIWEIFAEKDLRSVAKRFIEEGLEFMGYIAIGCGVYEERFFGREAAG